MALDVFIEFSILILLATAISGLMLILRQPLLLGYILTGILISPYFLNLTGDTTNINTLAQIGVVFLLFMVGLHLNPRMINDFGKVSLVTGMGQIIFTSIFGFLIATILSFSPLESMYIAIALTFSSTIIIMKILTDKKALETLYGKIAVGFLIVQDLLAMAILMGISSFASFSGSEDVALSRIIFGAFLLVFMFAFGGKLISRLMNLVAKSQEYLLLFSIGWGLALAALFHYLGFSIEIGALIAGMTISFSPYRHEVNSKIKPLREFFIVMFFIWLGSQMVFESIGEYILPTIVFSLFILIGNPLIVLILMGRMGYTARTGFLAGLTVAQISEFSMILVALGVRVGHLSNEILSFVTLVGLITIAGSTYMILHGEKLYRVLEKYLTLFERKNAKSEELPKSKEDLPQDLKGHIVVLGAHEKGRRVIDYLRNKGHLIVAVDNNPDVVESLDRKGVICIYGDMGNSETLEKVNLTTASVVISTVPDFEENYNLVVKTKGFNKDALVFANAESTEAALKLYDVGADYVLISKIVGGEMLLNVMINAIHTKDRMDILKQRQIRELEFRKAEDESRKIHNKSFIGDLKRRVNENFKKRSGIGNNSGKKHNYKK